MKPGAYRLDLAPRHVCGDSAAGDAGEVTGVLIGELIKPHRVLGLALAGRLPGLAKLKDGDLFRALAGGNTLTGTRTNTRSGESSSPYDQSRHRRVGYRPPGVQGPAPCRPLSNDASNLGITGY